MCIICKIIIVLEISEIYLTVPCIDFSKYLLLLYLYFIVGPLPTLLKGERWGEGWNFLLERGDKPEKGGWCRNWVVATFLLCYSSITFTLCVGKIKFSLLLFFLQSFELAMQDSHPSLYSIKTLYHLYISDSFW